ncbi:MAG: alpha-amylase [Anaerolineae bacterium]|nr:alpha-amylase [Anaerolineae bacterium]
MKHRVALIALLLMIAVLTGCGPTPTPEPAPVATSSKPVEEPTATAPPTATASPTKEPPTVTAPPIQDPAWWDDAVFYEVFVRSFYDSDGDGIGDLQGLTQRLDYLNDGDPTTTDDLGITGLWLMPIAQSPSYHGYDVVDYYTVEEDYGANEDFHTLIAEAHARGIRVIVDLVLNHTSSAHPWFVDASAGPEAEYRDWYVWSEEHPGYMGPWRQKVWHRHGEAYYYGIFWQGMPDLDYRNPEVTAAAYDVARFWLEEMGADGFRLDAVRHLIEDGQQQADTPQTHAWLTDLDRFTDGISPEVLTVGEVWADTADVVPYVANDELDLCFEFNLAEAIVRSVNDGTPTAFRHCLEEVLSTYPSGQYATFLTNHDQDRVMSQVGGNPDEARLAATILLTLPGVPFIYYGEEIGMVGHKPDEMIRTPMQWSAGENAGFTTGRPWEPVNDDYETVNVATKTAAPGSLLNRYRRLIHLRDEHVALRRGGLAPVKSSCHPVYGFLRQHPSAGSGQGEEESVLVLLNLSATEQGGCSFALPQSRLAPGDYAVRELLTGVTVPGLTVDENGGFSGYVPLETLTPQEGYILLLEPAGNW